MVPHGEAVVLMLLNKVSIIRKRISFTVKAT